MVLQGSERGVLEKGGGTESLIFTLAHCVSLERGV